MTHLRTIMMNHDYLWRQVKKMLVQIPYTQKLHDEIIKEQAMTINNISFSQIFPYISLT